jgi:xanthine dehydrogenase accessory factor
VDAILKKAYVAAKKGQSFAFATVVRSTPKGTPRKAGAKMVVSADGSMSGTIGGGRNEKAVIGECLEAIKSGLPRTVTYNYFGQKGQSVCGGQIEVFIEPFAGKRHLIICGAGHIALPLSVIFKMLNFRVTIIDDRKSLATKKRFPHVDTIKVGSHASLLETMQITPDTYIMIVTQGNEYDYECLKAVVGSSCPGYLGVISSNAKRQKFLRRLKNEGVSADLLEQIAMPAGLDIGAQTPEEIALSIASEIVSEYNKSWQGTAKFKAKKINLTIRREYRHGHKHDQR